MQVRAALCSEQSTQAVALAQSLASDDLVWQPEIIALLAHPTLTEDDARTLMQAGGITPNRLDITRQASVLSSIGRLGFLFPAWRYAARSLPFHGDGVTTTLLEEWAMTRLCRPNDESMGPAFVLEMPSRCRIELRRCCIVLSAPDKGILVVRNNSFYWGRTILRSAAMYAAPIGDGEENLHAERMGYADMGLPSLSQPGLWQPGVIDNIDFLIAEFNAFEGALSSWMGYQGLELLKILGQAISSTSASPPLLGDFSPNTPPWYPVQTAHLMDEVPMRELTRGAGEHGNIVHLLSSPKGDMPA